MKEHGMEIDRKEQEPFILKVDNTTMDRYKMEKLMDRDYL